MAAMISGEGAEARFGSSSRVRRTKLSWRTSKIALSIGVVLMSGSSCVSLGTGASISATILGNHLLFEQPVIATQAGWTALLVQMVADIRMVGTGHLVNRMRRAVRALQDKRNIRRYAQECSGKGGVGASGAGEQLR